MKHLSHTLFILTGLPLFADADMLLSPDTPPPVIEDYGATFFKMIMMLLSILALVILTVWIIKRWGHGRVGRFSNKQSIHIIEKRVLSPKSILYLVEIEGARILVAESQLEVRPLHQWPAPPPPQEEE